jgi:hypothetical protein
MASYRGIGSAQGASGGAAQSLWKSRKINDPAASCGVLTDDTTQQAAGYVSRKESSCFFQDSFLNFQKCVFPKNRLENRMCKNGLTPRKTGYPRGGKPAGNALFHIKVSESFISLTYVVPRYHFILSHTI